MYSPCKSELDLKHFVLAIFCKVQGVRSGHFAGTLVGDCMGGTLCSIFDLRVVTFT